VQSFEFTLGAFMWPQSPGNCEQKNDYTRTIRYSTQEVVMGYLQEIYSVRYFGINYTTVYTANDTLEPTCHGRNGCGWEFLRWWCLFALLRLMLYGPIVACGRCLDDINWYNGLRAAAWWTSVTPVMATQTSLMTPACSTYSVRRRI